MVVQDELEGLPHFPFADEAQAKLRPALVAGADFILTVNTAPGHFDRPDYNGICVTTPGRFIRLPEVQALLRSMP